MTGNQWAFKRVRYPASQTYVCDSTKVIGDSKRSVPERAVCSSDEKFHKNQDWWNLTGNMCGTFRHLWLEVQLIAALLVLPHKKRPIGSAFNG